MGHQIAIRYTFISSRQAQGTALYVFKCDYCLRLMAALGTEMMKLAQRVHNQFCRDPKAEAKGNGAE